MQVGSVKIAIIDEHLAIGSVTAAVQCDQQLTVVHAVVYNNYGARLFTAQIVRHQSIR